MLLYLTLPAASQQTENIASSVNSEVADPSSQLVDVVPTAQDEQIARRISNILERVAPNQFRILRL